MKTLRRSTLSGALFASLSLLFILSNNGVAAGGAQPQGANSIQLHREINSCLSRMLNELSEIENYFYNFQSGSIIVHLYARGYYTVTPTKFPHEVLAALHFPAVVVGDWVEDSATYSNTTYRSELLKLRDVFNVVADGSMTSNNYPPHFYFNCVMPLLRIQGDIIKLNSYIGKLPKL